MVLKAVVVSFVLFAVSLGAPAEDQIQELPGLKKQPNFKQFSGYLQASGTKRLHYWFVESENKPATDPVVLWMNGGPGCSSVLGLLTEHGPFRIQEDGVTLQFNPFSWNTVANVLYLESPAGVGYSYSNDGNYSTDDDITAHDNLLALQDFFKKFTEFSSNPFFITGESYGGVYVPTLSVLVADDPSINFQGFAVGNGLSSDELNDDSLVYFAYFHGLIGEDLWGSLITTCCKGNSTNCTFSKNAASSEACSVLLEQVFALLYGGDLNIYNLYGPCVKSSVSGRTVDFKTSIFDLTKQRLVTANFGWAFSTLPVVKEERQWIRKLSTGVSNGRLGVTPPCIDASGAIKYMNSLAVRVALHIPSQLPEWQPCSAINYNRIYSNMSAQYKTVLAKGKRVLVYNGDVDMACNFLGDEWFVDRLGLQSKSPRAEWTYIDEDHTSQVAGFVKAYELLTYVTVRGAGHMVPTDRPRPALKMFINFITNKPFN